MVATLKEAIEHRTRQQEFLSQAFTVCPRSWRTLACAFCHRCRSLLADKTGRPFRLQTKVDGKAVLVSRGNCTFAEKADHVEAAGGALALIMNTEPGAVSCRTCLSCLTSSICFPPKLPPMVSSSPTARHTSFSVRRRRRVHGLWRLEARPWSHAGDRSRHAPQDCRRSPHV